MKWDEACDASINNRAKRDNSEDEMWLIIDRDTAQISYSLDRGIDSRQVGPRGPVARVLVPKTNEDGDPILFTKKIVDVETIEKFDDWRPSVPRIVVEEVESLEDLDVDDEIEDFGDIDELIEELDGIDAAALIEELGFDD